MKIGLWVDLVVLKSLGSVDFRVLSYLNYWNLRGLRYWEILLLFVN